MNIEILESIIQELASRLAGATVDRVYENEEQALIFVLRSRGASFRLLLSPNRSEPRLHLITTRPTASERIHPFTLFVKSRITSARVSEISILNEDRIVALKMERLGTGYQLIFELRGHASNMILTDRNNTILAVYHPVTASPSSRQILPGAPYQLPPKKTGKTSLTMKSPGSAFPEEPEDLNRNAEVFYERLREEKLFLKERSRFLAVARKLTKKAERRRSALEQDRSRAANAEDWKRAGDLVLANLDKLQTGAKEAELTGYDGAVINVALDPCRSPVKNAEHFFLKYKKARNGMLFIEKRLESTRNELQLLENISKNIENAGSEAELALARAQLETAGLARITHLHESKKKQEQLPYRRILFRGWEILVGKNGSGNDQITTRIAKGEDLWLHAEGLPGSHVLVRNPEKKNYPEEVLIRAASLAAYYSKARHSAKAAVTYTMAKYVAKPRGAKEGLVTLSRRKTIVVVPAHE